MKVDKYDASTINNISKKYGFTSKFNIEKFIMDFSIHKLISEKMECCIRGGLCSPFYVKTPESWRLSVDIDLFMKLSHEEITKMVPEILIQAGLRCKLRKPIRISNLVQFDVWYKSALLKFDEKRRVKIDIQYSTDVDAFAQMLDKGQKPFIVGIDYAIKALRPGCLIGDKIPALAIGNMGYTDISKAPKQIHDIGYLLDSVGIDDIHDILSSFPTITQEKITHDKSGTTVNDAINAIIKFLQNLLMPNDELLVSKSYLNDFERFKGEYLSENQTYDINVIKSNILKTLLCALYIKAATESRMSKQQASTLMSESLVEYNRLSDSKYSTDVEIIQETHSKNLYNVKKETLQNLHLVKSVNTVWNVINQD